MSDKFTDGQLFNLISGNEITGESTFDIWRSLAGNENKTQEEFLEYMRVGASGLEIDSELSESSENPIQNKVVAEKFSELSATKADNPSTGKVGQIIAILTVDENGKPTSYQAIDKPSGAEISTEELQEAVNNYLAENPVSGLSVKEKETLLALFKSIEYTGDMSATVKRLEALFAGEEGIKYTVTYNLTNVTSSDSDNTIVEGSAKTITLIADEGFLLDAVAVTMNGEDITSSVYADGVITITSATGNIVITASAVNANILAPVYLLENRTFSGTEEELVDTGYKVFDEEKDFTIYFDVDVNTCTDFWLFQERTNNMYSGMFAQGGWYASIQGFQTITANVASDYNPKNIKGFVVRDSEADSFEIIYMENGEKVTNAYNDLTTKELYRNAIGNTYNMVVGGRYNTSTNDWALLKGTVNKFAIYERVLETTEINEYLGV